MKLPTNFVDYWVWVHLQHLEFAWKNGEPLDKPRGWRAAKKAGWKPPCKLVRSPTEIATFCAGSLQLAEITAIMARHQPDKFFPERQKMAQMFDQIDSNYRRAISEETVRQFVENHFGHEMVDPAEAELRKLWDGPGEFRRYR